MWSKRLWKWIKWHVSRLGSLFEAAGEVDVPVRMCLKPAIDAAFLRFLHVRWWQLNLAGHLGDLPLPNEQKKAHARCAPEWVIMKMSKVSSSTKPNDDPVALDGFHADCPVAHFGYRFDRLGVLGDCLVDRYYARLVRMSRTLVRVKREVRVWAEWLFSWYYF